MFFSFLASYVHLPEAAICSFGVEEFAVHNHQDSFPQRLEILQNWELSCGIILNCPEQEIIVRYEIILLAILIPGTNLRSSPKQDVWTPQC